MALDRPSFLFRSPHKGFVQNVRSSRKIYNDRGDQIGLEPALRAEFGIFGPERSVMNPETGEQVVVADIKGGFWDSRVAQEQNNWSDEDHDYVVLILRQVFEQRPDYGSEVVAVHVPAPLPWATYGDLTDAEEIVDLAQRLGLVPETVRYERENAERNQVLGPLERVLGGLPADDRTKAEPKMEIPPEDLEEAAPGHVNLGSAPATTDSGIVIGTPGLTLKPNPSQIVL